MKKVIGSYLKEEYEDGTTSEFYKKHGAVHREDGPALVIYSAGGKPVSDTYCRNGVIHREDGPAIVKRSPSGTEVHQESYFRNGKKHREGGPAIVTYSPYDPTIVVHESYYRDGKRHREDGPARIHRSYFGGNVVDERYFLNGVPVDVNCRPLDKAALSRLPSEEEVYRKQIYHGQGFKYFDPNHDLVELEKYKQRQSFTEKERNRIDSSRDPSR